MTATARFFARKVFPLVANIEVHGRENIPTGGGYILAGNHIGRLDMLIPHFLLDTRDVIVPFTDKYKKSLLFSFIAWATGMVWLKRGEPDVKAMRGMITRLKAGGVLVIAPEGTRSKTASLNRAETGVIFIAAQASALIMPLAMTGTEDALVKSSWRKLQRLKIVINIGKPYAPPPVRGAERDQILREATDELMCRIAALLPESYRGVYSNYPRTLQLLELNLSNP